MIKLFNHIGTISISDQYLTSLIVQTAESCFGVTGMCPCNAVQRLSAAMGKRCPSTGVAIRQNGNSISVDLHIAAASGVNIRAITESIAHKVAYVLTDLAGVSVSAINVYVDG